MYRGKPDCKSVDLLASTNPDIKPPASNKLMDWLTYWVCSGRYTHTVSINSQYDQDILFIQGGWVGKFFSEMLLLPWSQDEVRSKRAAQMPQIFFC